ncbi:hypothetical protein [Peribacillus butanolivorans]
MKQKWRYPIHMTIYLTHVPIQLKEILMLLTNELAATREMNI